INGGDLFIDLTDNSLWENEIEESMQKPIFPECSKVIGYYPLTKEAKRFDLPLLPNPFKNEVSYNKDAIIEAFYTNYREWKNRYQDYIDVDFNDWFNNKIEGKQEFISDKQFSLEDMKKAIDLTQQICDRNAHYVQRDRNVPVPMITIDEEEEIIQSLSTQQLPKEFIPILESKCWCLMPMSGCFECSNILKTITNSEGKKMLTGKWVY